MSNSSTEAKQDEAFFERVTLKVYDHLLEQMEALGNQALANQEYNTDFFRASEYTNREGYRYMTKTGGQFKTILFGQTCSSDYGTSLGAAGGYTQFQTPIADNIKVKEKLVLSKPKYADERTMLFFNNQVATLTDARLVEQQSELDNDERISFVQEWITAPPEGGTMDLIILRFQPKYQLPASAFTEPTRVTKRKLDKHTPQPQPIERGETSSGSTTNVGDFYPTRVLPDHQGDLFQHKKAMVVQRDIRDINNQLVPPWKEYIELRPGTVVLVEATAVCWAMKDNERGPTKKYYHLVPQSIRVLAESPMEPEQPPVRTLRTADRPSTSKKTSTLTTTPASEAFKKFQPPLKRKRE